MKVVIGTAHDAAYKDLAAITMPSVCAYAAKHRYKFIYDPNVHEDIKDACKVLLFQSAYEDGHGPYGPNDVFCWIDTDALVMNSERRIESIVHEHMPRSVHYLIGTDVNGINSGFFIARFSPEAVLFMQVASALSVISGWADQVGLVQTSISEPHKSIYKEVPGKVFNSNLYEIKGWNLGAYGPYINQYEPGDFILHLAGIEEPRRSDLLRHYARLAR